MSCRIMKIGDKVRFLSETGEGRITGFKDKKIVMVEDADGFEIPFAINEVVVIDNDNYDKKNEINNTAQQVQNVAKEKEAVKGDNHINYNYPVEERDGGEKLSVYFAFVPVDIKEVTKTRFETYIINDCNYYIRYNYLTAENNNWHLRSTGEVEPNTKLYIEEFGKEELNDYGRVCVQIMAYKKEKSFALKPTCQAQFRIDTVKFYKLHTFKENDFFETPAMVYTVIENDKVSNPLVVDAKQIKDKIYNNVSIEADDNYVRRYENKGKHGNPFRPKHKEDLLVIDLHANEILETTAGMSNSDILNYQLDLFRKTLEENKNIKGKKIVFIHGKGEGVLRQAIIHELNYRYKKYSYQDASFQEYGYGATQVTIH